MQAPLLAFNVAIYTELALESLPQLLLQLVNNAIMSSWSFLAVVSLLVTLAVLFIDVFRLRNAYTNGVHPLMVPIGQLADQPYANTGHALISDVEVRARLA